VEEEEAGCTEGNIYEAEEEEIIETPRYINVLSYH
jgi:hypothetical protein